MNVKVQNGMEMAGGILILIGAASFITPWGAFSPYIYSLGALLFVIPQLLQRYEGKNLIIRRLRRQQILGALLLLATSVLMFVCEHNEWMLSLTIAAVLELYTSFRIPQEEAREKNP